MLVDDEPDITNVLKRGLESHGYRVDVFNRPLEALDHDARRYDIAILDIAMPDMNGLALAQTLWQENSDLQICFLTAFEIMPTEAKIGLPNLKKHCFLKKPINIIHLAEHIESHLIRN